MNRNEHNKWRAKELFAETQKQGAHEFRGRWLAANDAAVSAVMQTDGVFDTAKPEVKALMSIAILSTLRASPSDAEQLSELRKVLRTLRHHLQKQPDVVALIDAALTHAPNTKGSI